MEIPQILIIELPYDSAILLLGIYSKKNTNSKRYVHSNVLGSIIYNSQDMERVCKELDTTERLKIWKQSKCPSIEEWIKKMWYVYV